MERYKKIRNGLNINIDMYLCEVGDLKYLLAIPENMRENAEMFVETYNSGGKQEEKYEGNVRNALSQNGNALDNLIINAVTDFPVVMPIVPDIIGMPDFEQLSLEAVQDFKMHEKVFKCIEDAKNKIKEITNKSVKDKIFLHGYSASGVFAQRFALIYPELVGRCLIGGAVGTIPVPTTKIGYPIGIGDYEELFGKKFNIDEYKKIKFGYYVGEREEQDAGEWNTEGEKYIEGKNQVRAPMHDMSFRGESTPKEVGILQRKLLGQTMNERYKKSIEANKEIGIDIEGIILKQADHRHIFNVNYTPTTQSLLNQLLAFHSRNVQLNPNAGACTLNLDESFQRKREEHSESDIEI